MGMRRNLADMGERGALCHWPKLKADNCTFSSHQSVALPPCQNPAWSLCASDVTAGRQWDLRVWSSLWIEYPASFSV